MSVKELRPQVGIGVLVVCDNSILLGKRIGNFGYGQWAPPGGHLEFGETPQECAARELYEETELIAEKFTFIGATNDIYKSENKHYITLFFATDTFSGTVINREPGKCERWEWFTYNNLPEPLFPSVANLLGSGFNLSGIAHYLRKPNGALKYSLLSSQAI